MRMVLNCLFQSTHPRRVWHCLRFLSMLSYKVSIHTPTKGVTCRAHMFIKHQRFQSTHPRRVWLIFVRWCTVFWAFQSTHPRRVWHANSSANPLSGEFQSTHPRRVWQDADGNKTLFPKFQSTHPRRVWPYVYSIKSKMWGFNPHTHEGCDAARASLQATRETFQSTHPRRVWPSIRLLTHYN